MLGVEQILICKRDKERDDDESEFPPWIWIASVSEHHPSTARAPPQQSRSSREVRKGEEEEDSNSQGIWWPELQEPFYPPPRPSGLRQRQGQELWPSGLWQRQGKEPVFSVNGNDNTAQKSKITRNPDISLDTLWFLLSLSEPVFKIAG